MRLLAWLKLGLLLVCWRAPEGVGRHVLLCDNGAIEIMLDAGIHQEWHVIPADRWISSRDFATLSYLAECVSHRAGKTTWLTGLACTGK